MPSVGFRPQPPVDDVVHALPVASAAQLARFFVLGIALDVALNGQRPGLGLLLFAIAVAIVMRPSMQPGAERDALLLAAVAFAAFIPLRASESLTALNVLTSASLFGLAAARDETPLIWARVEGYIRRAIHIVVSIVRAPAGLLGPLARLIGSVGGERLRSAVRWTLIVAPVLAIFLALLASADRVFGDLLLPGWPDLDLTGVASHTALIVLGALAGATLWLAARRPLLPPFPGTGESIFPQIRFAEWAAVLAGLDLLFAIFVGVQATFLFGGQRSVDVTPGLTYAQYARSGFFQLIVVAALTALVILAGWDLGARTDRRSERAFRLLVTVMVGLTGVILASALLRLALYEGAFGFTMNRLAGYVTICWIGAVLVILAVTIWTGARDRLITLVVIAGLASAFAVNLVNPERFVAERNVARFRATGKIDIEYLLSLGPDAKPSVASVLSELPLEQAVFERLCEQAETLAREPSGWRSANLGRASARAALDAAGVTPQRCP
jgi:hypothetical protein